VGSGPQQPARDTPPLPAGAVRRTTTHTSRRPGGAEGAVVFAARGEDVLGRGPAAGTTAAGIDATVDPRIEAGRPFLALTCTPAVPELAALVGRPTLRGLRRALMSALGDEEPTSLRHQLFDDLPLALTLAGVPLSATGMHPPPGTVDMDAMADICAGWARGGELLTIGAQLGYPPTATGPRAPGPAPAPTTPAPAHRAARGSAGDARTGGVATEVGPDTTPLGPLAMRRRRRIDVVAVAAGWEVEAFFRDSRTDEVGDEWVVHEYTVHAALDADLIFTRCAATVGVLPWRECPLALPSATRLVGTHAADLRERVHRDLTGTTTCTHLNDTLRALAALPHLTSLIDP
jgi:hypothetical protein